MTTQEQTALGILRGGRSYEEAAEISGLSVIDVIALWSRVGSK